MLERAFRLSWFLRTVAGGRLNVATAEPLYSPRLLSFGRGKMGMNWNNTTFAFLFCIIFGTDVSSHLTAGIRLKIISFSPKWIE